MSGEKKHSVGGDGCYFSFRVVRGTLYPDLRYAVYVLRSRWHRWLPGFGFATVFLLDLVREWSHNGVTVVRTEACWTLLGSLRKKTVIFMLHGFGLIAQWHVYICHDTKIFSDVLHTPSLIGLTLHLHLSRELHMHCTDHPFTWIRQL